MTDDGTAAWTRRGPMDEQAVEAAASAVASDLDEGDRLLGVPWRSIVRLDAMRGLALLALAAAIVLWPRRTDSVLAVLLGLALAIYTLTTTIAVARDRSRRQFTTLLSIGLAAGFAAALVARPDDSIVTVAQLAGAVLVVDGLLGLLPNTARGGDLSQRLSRAVLSAVGGGLLLLFPDRMLVVGISIGAVVVAAAGLIDILLPSAAGPVGDARNDGRVLPGTALVTWIRHRPDLAEDRGDLMDKLYYEGSSSATRFARFLALMSFASVIASVGVVLESTAVVIGAMLIAPLMVPLMGTALAVPMGWPRRLRRSAGVAMSGIVLSITVGAVVGALVPRTVDVASNTEILARITPTVVDLVVAVAAGAAGAYALARKDVSDSLPGVAVAIALVPPLTVVGLCWQQGAWVEGTGALLLFITNGIAILIAGGAMFLVVGAVPLRRLSLTRQRLRTITTGLVVFAVGVTVLLSLNAAELASSDLARAGVDEVLADWSDTEEQYRVLDVRTRADGTLVIDLAGPGEPPGLEQLLEDLREPVGPETTIEVTWIPQQRVRVPGR